MAQSGTVFVYVGTYTRGRQEGIHRFRMDEKSGALEPLGASDAGEDPSFLAIDPERNHLFAVNEMSQFRGESSGAVSALAIDPRTGDLKRLNQQSSVGPGPCHLSVDRTGQFVLVANYGGGSFCVLPVHGDGQLGAACDFVQHHRTDEPGSGPPRGHSIQMDPANRFAIAADLGLDKIFVYRLDPATGKLTPNDPPWAVLKPGSGPRHFAFHPSGRFAYAINETASSMTGFTYDKAHGALHEIETLSTLPQGFAGNNSCAEVQVSPNGRFVYGSNRGHDSVALFAIDERTGRMTPAGHEPTQGRNPRNFSLDPTGRYLYAANQDSDSVVTFHADPATGRLTPTGAVTKVPAPVCVKFLTVRTPA